MSMGYGAAFAEVIEEKSIQKFCKKEFDYFINLAHECELDLEEFARNASFDELEDYDKDILKAYENLCEAFEKKTGLTLFMGFHNSDDDGSTYDEVSGIYWAVGNMYQLTPAGKKMKKYVERKFFVHFG